MKVSRMKITAVLLTAAFTLTGCGDSLYVLTPEEEAEIVSYVAHTVAKFNTYQQDGEVFVPPEVPEDEEEPEEDTVIQETGQEPEISDTETEAADTAGNTEGSEEASVTLTEALDLGVVAAEFAGSSLCTTYDKSEVYAVDADPGQQLLVLKVNLHNQVDQDLHIDILAMTPEFRAVINGDRTVAAQTTILPNDLSTYQQDILAGATNETVLLFQIPLEIQEISSIQLKISMNGNHYTVNV